jgi:hypothetical protein
VARFRDAPEAGHHSNPNVPDENERQLAHFMARIRFACVHCNRSLDAGEECGCQKTRAPVTASEPAAAPPDSQKRSRPKKSRDA